MILTTPIISKPLWVRSKEQRDQFENIIGKFRVVESAKDEVEAFTKREGKDDGNFMILVKKAGDDAKDIKRCL